jgi:hypothetical protein
LADAAAAENRTIVVKQTRGDQLLDLLEPVQERTCLLAIGDDRLRQRGDHDGDGVGVPDVWNAVAVTVGRFVQRRRNDRDSERGDE